METFRFELFGEDEFAGPTNVDRKPHLAEGTPPPTPMERIWPPGEVQHELAGHHDTTAAQVANRVASEKSTLQLVMMELTRAESIIPVEDEQLCATSKWQRVDATVEEPARPPRMHIKRIPKVLVISVLIAAMTALVAYVAVTLFYLLGHSWLAPIRVSATDPAVVAARDELAVHKRERDRLAAELAVAGTDTHAALVASLARADHVIANLEGSGYLRALADRADVAQVPYSNLEAAQPGAAVYACRLEMLWCRNVGSVMAVLPGEVQFRHPHRDAQMRGQLVELHVDEAVHDAVLFVGGKPLGL